MEYSSADAIKAKSILISLLKKFDEFCSQNGLRYFASGGTCLGAIRHKGFIPWDDDIDVLMPRKDYEKFLSLKTTLFGSGYEICDPTDKGYYLPFAKFCETQTTLVELQKKPFLFGQFIDVFPQDEAENTKVCRKLFKKRMTSFSRYSKCLSNNNFLDILMTKGIPSKLKSFVFFLFGCVLKKIFWNQYIKAEFAIKSQKGTHVMYYGGPYGFDREFNDKESFVEGIRVPFENISVIVPKGYDSYLSKLYGDYMTPPPVEKQISHHYHYFFDLNKRWTLENVMKLNLGKQKPMNFKYE